MSRESIRLHWWNRNILLKKIPARSVRSICAHRSIDQNQSSGKLEIDEENSKGFSSLWILYTDMLGLLFRIWLNRLETGIEQLESKTADYFLNCSEFMFLSSIPNWSILVKIRGLSCTKNGWELKLDQKESVHERFVGLCIHKGFGNRWILYCFSDFFKEPRGWGGSGRT